MWTGNKKNFNLWLDHLLEILQVSLMERKRIMIKTLCFFTLGLIWPKCCQCFGPWDLTTLQEYGSCVLQEVGSATESQKQNSLIKERVWNWHLRKGKGSRSGQREELSCGAGQIASADPTGSSEAEMMTHQLSQVRQKPLGLYISVSISHWTWLLLKVKGKQQSESRGSPWRNWQLEKQQCSQKLGQQVLPWRGIWEVHLWVHPGTGCCDSYIDFILSFIKRKEKDFCML